MTAWAVIRGSAKLILGPQGEAERYDLRADPREETPAPSDPAHTEDLRRALADFRSHTLANAATPSGVELDPATREHLRALGYVN